MLTCNGELLVAEAAGTTADRVAVQSVHQHNAPFACLNAQKIVAAEGDLPVIIDVGFFKKMFRSCTSISQKRIKENAIANSHCPWAGNGK